MKKSIIASILTASLLAASIAPVYGAEFISDPVEIFSAGEEAPELEVPEENEIPAASYDEDEEEYFNVEMRIVKAPVKTHFAYGLEVEGPSQFIADGLQVEMVKPDGTIADTVTFEDGENCLDGKYCYRWSLYDGDERVYDEKLHIGEYKIVVDEEWTGKTAATTIYVDTPQTLIPELEKTGEDTYSSTVPFYSGRSSAWVRFTAKHTGPYKIEAAAPEAAVSPRLRVMKANENQEYVYSTGVEDDVYSLEEGQEYYLGYEADYIDSEKEESATFKVTERPYLTSMEWVKKPSKPLYSGVTLQNIGDNNGGHISGDFADGTIKLIYSDGEEEVCEAPYFNSKRGDYIENRIACKNVVAAPGTYKATFQIYGNKKFSLTADVKVKAASELPTIKSTGSATAKFESSAAYVYVVTGSKTVYKATCNVKDVNLSFHEIGTESYSDCEVGGTLRLKPNTKYCLFAYGPGMQSVDAVTYKVSAGKLSLSKFYTENLKSAAYTGKAIKPSVKILDNRGAQLKKDKDYTVSYSNNTKIGTATVTIKGKGEFTGTIKKTFQIVPGRVSITSYKRTGNTSAKIVWKSVKGAYGYVVYRATGNTWTRVGTTRSTNFTDKKIKKGIAYKYKVRAYGKAGSKNIYGADSTVKTIKK